MNRQKNMRNYIEEDAALYQRIADGDRQAEGMLYEKFQGRILSFLVCRGVSGEDAEDICQEVLMAAILACRSRGIANPNNLGGFVFGIAKNKYKDWLRKRERAGKLFISSDPQLEPEGKQGDTPVAPRNPEQDAIRQDEIERFEKTFSKLNNYDQNLLRLFYFEELACKEIAGRLGKSDEAVRQDLTRNRRRLRGDMGDPE